MANHENDYCQLDIPLYTISAVLHGKYYCLAGGGGLSKTGIKNKMILVTYDQKTHQITVEKQLEVPYGAITSSAWNEQLKIMIFGIENNTVLYKIDEIQSENILSIDLVVAIDLFKDDLLQENDSINVIKLLNQTNRCLIGTVCGKIILFDIATTNYQLIIKTPNNQEIHDLSINPFDQLIACATIGQSSFVYSLDSFEEIVDLCLIFHSHDSNDQYIIRNCLFTKNNCLLTTHHYVNKYNKWTNKQSNQRIVSTDNYLVIWSEDTLIPLLKYSFDHSKSIFLHQCVSNFFILGCIDGSLNIFDTTTFKFVKSIKQKHKLAMTSIANYSMPQTSHSSNSDKVLTVITAAADSSVFLSTIKIPNHSYNLSIWLGVSSMFAIVIIAIITQTFIYF